MGSQESARWLHLPHSKRKSHFITIYLLCLLILCCQATVTLSEKDGRPFRRRDGICTDHGVGLYQVVPASSAGKLAETRLRAAHCDVWRRHQQFPTPRAA